jgi:FAD:protein FMN transferase
MRRAQPWLGTLVDIQCAGGDASTALEAAFAAIARVHARMSPQLPDSDLARFNAAHAGTAIDCGVDTVVVLQASRALAEQSDGIFDPTQGYGGLAGWSLTGHRLHKHHREARLDLGGIAKGYAVDLAIAALQDRGCTRGVVNAGGDLRVFGPLEWPIHIRHPDAPAHTQPLLMLRDGAFATSWLPLPGGGQTCVSVGAPQCLWADALTKIVAYTPAAQSAALLARYDAYPFHHRF